MLSKTCNPGRCLATESTVNAASIFEAEEQADKCIDPCLCTSTGLVRNMNIDGQTVGNLDIDLFFILGLR